MIITLEPESILRQITVTVEVKPMFGFCGWRRRLGLALFILGAYVMRVNLEVKTP